VTYGYDLLNRMASVTDWLGGVTAYTYDAAGNLIHTANPNASAVNYGYDTASRLISLINSGPNSATISSYAYTLDAIGNHTQVNQTEQLQTLPAVGSSDYTYDNDNRMTALDGSPQGFDANGNMVSINVADTLSYDYENRLTQAAFVDTSTNIYQYDGAGNRMSADRDGLVTRYVLDRNSSLTQVLAETDAGGTITACYVYGLGLISKLDANGGSHYYHFDSRGSTVALTDATGQITDAYAYDPFGRPRHFSDPTDNRFRYLGRHGVIFEEGNFYYVRARFYSTRRGRFISKDPTTGNDSDGQSLNRYIYALNNPERLIDISGLSAQEGASRSSLGASSDLNHMILIDLSSSQISSILLNTLLKQTPEVLDAIGKYLAAGGGSGLSVNFSPTTWKVIQETLPGLEFSRFGNVLSHSVPFIGIGIGLASGAYNTRNQNLDWDERAARILFEVPKAIAVTLLSVPLTPYGGAAAGVALDYYSDPLYHGLVEIPGQFLGEHVTYPIGHALGFYP
jgi:RHS repeat-associated protein